MSLTAGMRGPATSRQRRSFRAALSGGSVMFSGVVMSSNWRNCPTVTLSRCRPSNSAKSSSEKRQSFEVNFEAGTSRWSDTVRAFGLASPSASSYGCVITASLRRGMSIPSQGSFESVIWYISGLHARFIPGDGDLSVEEVLAYVVAGDKDGHNLAAMPHDVPLDLRTHDRQTTRVADSGLNATREENHQDPGSDIGSPSGDGQGRIQTPPTRTRDHLLGVASRQASRHSAGRICACTHATSHNEPLTARGSGASGSSTATSPIDALLRVSPRGGMGTDAKGKVHRVRVCGCAGPRGCLAGVR
jgi:hypothetical protein